MTESMCTYRCYGLLDTTRGRWQQWSFRPVAAEDEMRLAAEAAATGRVLFASAQLFAPPRDVPTSTQWKRVRDQYQGEQAMPHWSPLYFDVDCEGDLERALVSTRYLVDYFRCHLELPEPAIRVWFSGSKGAHVMVDANALAVVPSATLIMDMKVIVLDLARQLASLGMPELTLDAAVYSLPRMIRMPDQPNPRSGLCKVELSHEELFRLSAGEIMALARQPRGALWTPEDLPDGPEELASLWWAAQLSKAKQSREFRVRTAQVTGQKVRPDGCVVDELVTATMPACIKGILGASADPGSRNRCELQIACWAKAAKLPFADALALLTSWTDRNRPELSADNAQRKAESILHCVYGGSTYGHSCTAARTAAQSVGVAATCDTCRAVEPRHMRQLFSLRVRHDEQWVPPVMITLEDARGLIASGVSQCIAAHAPVQSHTRESAARRRQESRRAARPGHAQDEVLVRSTDA